jgi:hypothetical protein
MSVAVSMVVIAGRPFDKIINVGPLDHLRKIQRYPVKHCSRLSVCVDMFVTSPRNGCRTGHQLRDHEENYHKDKYRYE